VPVYWEDTLDPVTKAFKPATDIARLYRDKGITAKDEVTVYCQVGMRASHDIFTLALIGHDLNKLANYYGAWEEWNGDDTIKQAVSARRPGASIGDCRLPIGRFIGRSGE
jgi:3-mercaptopyruvate sulfurtransferase SseA